MKIAILGGTGSEGGGLGFRWAAAGHEIIIGSRSAERAESAAAEMRAKLPPNSGSVTGAANAEAAAAAELVVLSVPYTAQAATLADVKDEVQGKLLLTVVAPLGKPAGRVIRLESGLSAAEEAQQQLGEGVRVVAAFQNISAHYLEDLEQVVDCDVLVCGEKKDDKEIVMGLCKDAQFRGINAGALQNAAVAEGLTAVLISINVLNKVNHSGIRITGV